MGDDSTVRTGEHAGEVILLRIGDYIIFWFAIFVFPMKNFRSVAPVKRSRDCCGAVRKFSIGLYLEPFQQARCVELMFRKTDVPQFPCWVVDGECVWVEVKHLFLAEYAGVW